MTREERGKGSSAAKVSRVRRAVDTKARSGARPREKIAARIAAAALRPRLLSGAYAAGCPGGSLAVPFRLLIPTVSLSLMLNIPGERLRLLPVRDPVSSPLLRHFPAVTSSTAVASSTPCGCSRRRDRCGAGRQCRARWTTPASRRMCARPGRRAAPSPGRAASVRGYVRRSKQPPVFDDTPRRTGFDRYRDCVREPFGDAETSGARVELV